MLVEVYAESRNSHNLRQHDQKILRLSNHRTGKGDGKLVGREQAPGIITSGFKKFDFDSVLKALEFLGAHTASLHLRLRI